MRRTASRVLLVALVGVGLALPVGSVAAAPQEPSLTTVGSSESPEVSSWLGATGDVTVFTPSGPDPLRFEGARDGLGRMSARGWIRQLGGADAVVVATLTDAGGNEAVSAPLHLGAPWQTFGVTGPSGTAGPLSLALAPADGESWPTDARIEVAGIEIGATGRSTLERQPGTNYFVLTRSGDRPRPFTAHGFVYWPVPIEGTLFVPWADPATCQADAQILRGLGVTLLQAPLETDVYANPVGMVQCADAFWAAGIGVVWLSNQPPQRPHEYGPAYNAMYRAYLDHAISVVGVHPATYAWMIGNEENAPNRDAGCFFDEPPPGQPECEDPENRGNTLARMVDHLHANDPGHPVTTKLRPEGWCRPGRKTVSPENVPALDFWSHSIYRMRGFGRVFTCLQGHDPTRPVLVAEFGNARLNCRPGPITIDSGNFRTTVCRPGSAEASDVQAEANAHLWEEIVAEQATPENPSGLLLGGTQFTYSDPWFLSLVGPQMSHDGIGQSWTQGPNGWWTPEWVGSTHAQLAAQAGQPRVTTPSLATIAQVWGPPEGPPGQPPGQSDSPQGRGRLPFISDVTIVPQAAPDGTCVVRAAWATAVAATSRVDWGQAEIVTATDGSLLADNTKYTNHVEDDAFTTDHAVTVPGPFVPGHTYRFVVRGFDITHGSDASAGDDVTIPTELCT